MSRILEELKREDLTRAEVLRRLKAATKRRERADVIRDDADREIAELTAVARARELVPLQDMTEALGTSREFVTWLQRKYKVGSIASLRKHLNGRRS